jgi:hypothetical protein
MMKITDAAHKNTTESNTTSVNRDRGFSTGSEISLESMPAPKPPLAGFLRGAWRLLEEWPKGQGFSPSSPEQVN